MIYLRPFFLIPLSLVFWCSIIKAETRPNIIFIFIDDQGYYDLGCYGATELNTPEIDRLASEGIRFTDYYAAAPICSASRAGLLTGCYPRRVGNHIWVHRADSPSGINPDELTLSELFQQNGYATACIGKWHLGFHEAFLPHNQGFDYYFGLLSNLDDIEKSFYKGGNVPLVRNGETLDRPVDPAELTELYTNEAINWIKTQKSDSAFFLYLPHTMLHNPLGVSSKFQGTSNFGMLGDATHELDFHIGRLMDTLDELGIADNTLVVYASDNGRGPGRNPQQPLRGNKLTTYEAGIRVPAIIWGPGLGIQQGVESAEIVNGTDWYATLATFAGIKIPEEVVLDSRDLSTLFTGKSPTIPKADSGVSLNADVPLRRQFLQSGEWQRVITPDEYLNAFFYHGSQGSLAAVRSGKWKLYLNPTLTLYDLEQDPGETTPLNNREVKRKLRGMVVEFNEEMRRDARPAGDYLEYGRGKRGY